MLDDAPTSLVEHTVIYGGSFNPPHLGHQMACLYLLEGLRADEVWIVPSHRHPFGKQLAAFEQRLRMCQMLADPFGSRALVSPVERALRGQGRTYDLLSHLTEAYPNRRFALAVGADILGETEAWHRWEELQATWRVVVIGRTGSLGPTSSLFALPNICSSELRRRLAAGEPIDGLVPAAVADFIRENNLYG